jgi:hypothetical protein
MDKRTKKALLYSALASPGLGHWMLGRRKRGALLVLGFGGLVGLFCVRLALTMVRYYDEMMEIFAATGEVMPDASRIHEMHLSIYLDNGLLIGAILGLWVFGIWDIYPRRGGA